jgi:hypothetical protein
VTKNTASIITVSTKQKKLSHLQMEEKQINPKIKKINWE